MSRRSGPGFSRDPLLFLAPALGIVAVFFVLPVILTFALSLTDMSSVTGLERWSFIGVDNYDKLTSSSRALARLWLTLQYVACTLVFFNLGMALLIAILSAEMPRRVASLVRAVWLLPRITPTVVYIMMWNFLAADAPYGILNQVLLGPLGIEPQQWVAARPFLMIVVVNGYIGASFGMLIFVSAIEAIPVDRMRAAMVDGAGLWQRTRHIILPALRWPILFVTIFQTLALLTSFEQILILTDGNYDTEVWALWAYHRALSNYFGNFQWGYGSALACVLVALGVVFAVVYMRLLRMRDLVEPPKVESL